MRRPPNRSIRYFFAVLILIASTVVGILSLWRSLGTLGQSYAGFFYGPNLLVAINQREVWPGIKKGLESLDRIEAVNDVEIERASELQEIVGSTPVGQQLDYRILRDGHTRNISVPVSEVRLSDFIVSFLAPFLMGVLFLAFGAVIYFAQPSAVISFVYLLLCCLIGVFCMVIYEAYTGYAFFRITMLYPFIGALSTHLFSLLPSTRRMGRRIRGVVYFLYLFAAGLVVWRQAYLYEPMASALLSKLASLYVVLILAANVMLLVRGYQMARSQEERDRVKVLVIGLILASSVVAAWSLNFLWGARSFYMDEGILVASVFPLFMAYSVLRRNIFSLDRVIRLGLTYGVAAAILLLLYLTGVGLVESLLPENFSVTPGVWFFVAICAIGAVLFNLIRDSLSSWVRKFLFRHSYNVSSALEKLERMLASGLRTPELVETLAIELKHVFGLKRTAVLVFRAEGTGRPMYRTFGWKTSENLDSWLALFQTEGLVEFLEKEKEPLYVSQILAQYPGQYESSLAKLRAQELEIVVPIMTSKSLLGLFFLGKRVSDGSFIVEDLDLLKPFALRTGIAVENAELHAQYESQARLAALGKVASIMIHDIKNPLSTVKISAGTIKRRLKDENSYRELAEMIEEEVDRMNLTVSDILTYVRPRGLSRSSVVLNDLVRETCMKQTAAFEGAGIQLKIDLNAENTPVYIDRLQIERALMNLLTNAREAVPEGGSVTVQTETKGKSNGRAKDVITVSDTGKGMDRETREGAFSAFFSTKERGTGLGLTIVDQVVKEHGGQVELQSIQGKGTTFRLSFPHKEQE